MTEKEKHEDGEGRGAKFQPEPKPKAKPNKPIEMRLIAKQEIVRGRNFTVVIKNGKLEPNAFVSQVI